jgi:NADP-reducing hydrogenase subunit HndB
MTKVKSLSDLKAMKEKFQSTLDVREKGNNQEEMVQITVAMATCGIASGAKQVMEYMMEKAEAMNISTVFTQTGCMGFCHAEPTVEVKIPGKEPLVFGHVDNKKADEIFEKYILNNEMVDGVLTPKDKVTDK